MMRSLPHLVSTALICVAVVSCAETPKKQVQAVDPANIARGSSAAVQFSVYVEAVDAGQRLITLKGPRGNAGVYEVGE